MLGLPFQPARREWDWALACRRFRTQSRIAARLHFTPALQGSGLTWNADTFIQFLADPTKLVPGTAMTVMVQDAGGRANLFAYLATLKDTTAETKPSGPAKPKITGPTEADLDGAAAATETWLYASHDYAGSRFVDLKQITPADAKELRPVCLYRSEQSASVQTSPLVYGGGMYLTFGRATVAIDAKTCRERSAIQDLHDVGDLFRFLVEVVSQDIAAGVIEIAGAAIDIRDGVRLAAPRHDVLGRVADLYAVDAPRERRLDHDLAQDLVVLGEEELDAVERPGEIAAAGVRSLGVGLPHAIARVAEGDRDPLDARHRLCVRSRR